jgi:hypothetical protein
VAKHINLTFGGAQCVWPEEQKTWVAAMERSAFCLAVAWAVVLILLAALFNLAWWAIWTPAEFLADCALRLMREHEY